MGANVNDRGTSVQRPLARQRVMLSRRVNAYYGLIRASGSTAPVANHRLFHAREAALSGRARGSPIYSAWLCGHAAPVDKMTAQGADRTDVAVKYLPLNCLAPAAP